ncbi:MAG: hypothetical protein NC133_00110 [Prevotella sp.]|nr:hypothetical protein [Prevotella sp.]
MAPFTKAKIAKIAGNNPKVMQGIESMLNGEVIFHSFERALSLLIIAKNEHYLQAVEAGLQVTINEIKNYYAQHSPYMDDEKTSLWLYTLQYLITNLGKWEFANKKENHYQPSLMQKLRYVEIKGANLGLRNNTIHNECFTKDHQRPNDQDLRNFEFLDEQRLDSFTNRLNKFEITQNPHDLFDSTRSFQASQQSAFTHNYVNILEKVIQHLQATLHVLEFDLTYLIQHAELINQEIAKYIGSHDQDKIDSINKAIFRHIEKQRQVKLANLNEKNR